MSNSEHTTAHAVTPGDDSRLTVEDTGSTTDASDLARDDADRGSDRVTTTTTSSGTQGGGLGSLPDDDSIGHVFDQTNGVIEGADGDSDGTADSDVSSGAERGEGNGLLGGVMPLGGDANGTRGRDQDD